MISCGTLVLGYFLLPGVLAEHFHNSQTPRMRQMKMIISNYKVIILLCNICWEVQQPCYHALCTIHSSVCSQKFKLHSKVLFDSICCYSWIISNTIQTIMSFVLCS